MGAAIDSGKGRKGGITPVINVTPLVDVVLVLLIIFMLVIPNVQEGRPIEMVKVDVADQLADDQEPIIVTVDRDEHYLVGTQELPLDGVVAEVVALTSDDPRQRVLLRADAALRYQPVRELLHELQAGGVTNVAFAVGVASDAAGLVADGGEG